MVLRILISLGAAVALVAHHVWPDLSIDTTTFLLVALGMMPWFRSLIKSIELPGGIKIELPETKAATEKITSSKCSHELAGHIRVRPSTSQPNLQIRSPSEISTEHIREIGSRDPNLAVVAVGVEIEKRLLGLAEVWGLDPFRRSLGSLLRGLEDANALPSEVATGICEFIDLRNRAAHGVSVSSEAAEWVLYAFPGMLEVLDELITNAKNPPDFPE